MRAFLIAALAVLSSAAGLILVRARRLRARHRAVFGAPLPDLEPAAERLLDAPRALYHGTRFADGPPILAARWREACVGDLWCTAGGIFLRREEGGEPLVITDTKHHTLIYTAHEGTTHLYRNGIVNPTDFVANYRNQVNIWVSKNDGRTWTHVDFAGTGFDQPPTQNTGFSDPDLTKDQSGRVYNRKSTRLNSSH